MAEDAPFPWDLVEGAKGVQLAQLGLRSAAEGRRLEVPELARVSRVAFAAAHVVADPETPTTLDWEATLAFRRHLWSHGLGVADAMDTAQRGMGLDWPVTQELIARSGAEARACGGRLACGAGTDQLSGEASLDEIAAAYEEQVEIVEAAGAQVIVMASRALAAAARGPEDYADVLGRVLGGVSQPAILHWLGPMFDPALEGYWGSGDLDAAADACLAIIAEHAARIDGIKISLLDEEREIAFRSRLPEGVRLYTGDDFNYPSLIRSGSDALLGIFDPIAPAAAAALAALDEGDLDRYEAIFAPTVPLARHLFSAPTSAYKTGIVFLAWLAGHQEHFRMVGGMETRALGGAPRAGLRARRRPRGCCPTPSWRRRGCGSCSGWRGSAREAVRAPQPQPDHDQRLERARGGRGLRARRHRLDRAVARQGGRDRPGGVPARGARRGAAGVEPVPRRLLPGRRRGRARAGARREPARDRGGGRCSAPTCSCSCAAACPRARATCRARGRWCATGSPRCWATRPPAACGSASSRCTRCSAPTARSSRTLERGHHARAAVPRRPGRRRDRRLPRVVGPAGGGGDRPAGREQRILAFHIDDWVLPLPAGALTGRGLPGEGCADLAGLHRAIAAAGYDGPIEVEVLNERVWETPGDEVLARLVAEVDGVLDPASGDERRRGCWSSRSPAVPGRSGRLGQLRLGREAAVRESGWRVVERCVRDRAIAARTTHPEIRSGGALVGGGTS